METYHCQLLSDWRQIRSVECEQKYRLRLNVYYDNHQLLKVSPNPNPDKISSLKWEASLNKLFEQHSQFEITLIPRQAQISVGIYPILKKNHLEEKFFFVLL